MQPRSVAVIGAGPVGLALALHAARALSGAYITVYDARSADLDPSADPRTLALSLGSVQLFERLHVYPAGEARPILEVHVSEASSHRAPLRIRAAEEGVPMLGAVLSYGRVVGPLQAAWKAACEREPARLASRFGVPVASLNAVDDAVEIEAGATERHAVAVIAEGGVSIGVSSRIAIRDYGQTAWVGRVTCSAPAEGVAYERFTPEGPAALLPLPESGRYGLIWCVQSHRDEIASLGDAARLARLNEIFKGIVAPLVELSPLKAFALSLRAERALVCGRTVRIGNSAQTLHPVAGQGLNLGLRDAFELVEALGRGHDVDRSLRGFARRRVLDRWSMIATTDLLARSFTWRLPGARTLRALGLSALQGLGPARSALAREMMFGRR